MYLLRRGARLGSLRPPNGSWLRWRSRRESPVPRTLLLDPEEVAPLLLFVELGWLFVLLLNTVM